MNVTTCFHELAKVGKGKSKEEMEEMHVHKTFQTLVGAALPLNHWCIPPVSASDLHNCTSLPINLRPYTHHQYGWAEIQVRCFWQSDIYDCLIKGSIPSIAQFLCTVREVPNTTSLVAVVKLVTHFTARITSTSSPCLIRPKQWQRERNCDLIKPDVPLQTWSSWGGEDSMLVTWPVWSRALQSFTLMMRLSWIRSVRTSSREWKSWML